MSGLPVRSTALVLFRRNTAEVARANVARAFADGVARLPQSMSSNQRFVDGDVSSRSVFHEECHVRCQIKQRRQDAQVDGPQLMRNE